MSTTLSEPVRELDIRKAKDDLERSISKLSERVSSLTELQNYVMRPIEQPSSPDKEPKPYNGTTQLSQILFSFRDRIDDSTYQLTLIMEQTEF